MKLAIITTGAAFLASVICKSEHRPIRYFFVFVLSLAASYAMGCNAFEFHQFDAKLFQQFDAELSKEWREVYEEKCKYHKKMAEARFENARSTALFWGDETEKMKANYCFRVLLATLAPSTPMSKVVAAAIAFIADYGMDVMDRWHMIRSYLLEAEYHYKMLEFYEEVLIKA